MRIKSIGAVCTIFAAACSAPANPDGGPNAGDAGDTGVVVRPDVPPGTDVPNPRIDVPTGVDVPTGADVPNAADVPNPPTDTGVCGMGTTACGMSGCVDTQTDNMNCGACGTACPMGRTCQAGMCACAMGTTMCGATCANTMTDSMNCGACGTACPMGQMCVAGGCRVDCPAPNSICGMGAMMTCVNQQTDSTNCGACGNACMAANGSAACAAGMCTVSMCNAGFGNCDMMAANGCETNTNTTAANCGRCGNACAVPANGAAACAAGVCGLGACNMGFGNCNNNAADGCEVNLSNTVANCGACGTICAAANGVPACNAGACAVQSCNAGFGNCDMLAANGCEATLATDAANCGACGTRCAMGQSCVAGMCQAAPVASVGGPVFQINTLGTTNCVAGPDHAAVTGDDRGGIALSSQRVFYSGDTATGAFDRNTAIGVRIAPAAIYDSMVGDFRSQTAYVFATGGGIIGQAGGLADRLIPLDPTTGAATGTPVMLSTTVNLTGNPGIFSGWGRVVVLTAGRAFNIMMPSGRVTDVGAVAIPAAHNNCESWAFWGTAEYFGGQLYVNYVASPTSIARMAVPSGVIAQVNAFANLSDMCSFTASPWTNRWYWHHEGSSQFTMNNDENFGFCDAAYTTDAFQVTSLSTSACTSLEVNVATGDDRGGIALTNTQVLLTGDGQTGRFSPADLSGGVATARILDGMFTNLANESAFTFTRAGAAVVNGAPGNVDGIQALDNNGTPTGPITPLSRTIAIAGGNGIFSGFNRVVVATGGRAIEADIASGAVADLGAFVQQSPFTCEGWGGYYGVAELINGETWLTYARTAAFPATEIGRQLVGTTTVQPIARFQSGNGALSDMCTFTVSPSRNRWYFHYEGTGFAGARDETLGFCDASVNRSPAFQMRTLSTANCRILEVAATTGDDRGGIATSLTRAFLTGDTATGHFSMADLTGGASIGRVADTIVNNLATGQVFAFADAMGNFPAAGGGGQSLFVQLIELDGNNGATTMNRIALSTPIALTMGGPGTSAVGIYSGFNRIAIHERSNVFNIDLPSGTVRLASAAIPQPVRTGSESWAYWGVAEYFGNELYISQVLNAQTISRIRVSNNIVTNVGAFMSLSDMASFTFSPQYNRWYWHHEGPSQFGGNDESLGFCDGAFSAAP